MPNVKNSNWNRLISSVINVQVSDTRDDHSSTSDDK